MLKKNFSLGMIFALTALFVVPVAHLSAGNWNSGTKTERTKVADGVYVERKINKKTGKIKKTEKTYKNL